jgi:glutamine amidotransferase
MCELFGLSCNRPVGVGFTWRGFLAGGSSHRDGWGVGFYPDGFSACVIKEPRPSTESPVARFLNFADIVVSKIVISHVRTASKGAVTYRNTHPFVRELFGREWVFAHNGTIIGETLKPRFYEPVGETDSEAAFCLILDRLRGLGRGAGLEEKAKVIEDEARRFSELSDKFNFLMSDGEHLYAFRSKGGSLYYTIRAPPHSGVLKLVDEDFEVNLGDLKGEGEVATIVATRELTVGEAWMNLPAEKLTIFKDGLPYLTKGERSILTYIRRSPHRVSIKEI